MCGARAALVTPELVEHVAEVFVRIRCCLSVACATCHVHGFHCVIKRAFARDRYDLCGKAHTGFGSSACFFFGWGGFEAIIGPCFPRQREPQDS